MIAHSRRFPSYCAFFSPGESPAAQHLRGCIPATHRDQEHLKCVLWHLSVFERIPLISDKPPVGALCRLHEIEGTSMIRMRNFAEQRVHDCELTFGCFPIIVIVHCVNCVRNPYRSAFCHGQEFRNDISFPMFLQRCSEQRLGNDLAELLRIMVPCRFREFLEAVCCECRRFTMTTQQDHCCKNVWFDQVRNYRRFKTMRSAQGRRCDVSSPRCQVRRTNSQEFILSVADNRSGYRFGERNEW